MVTTRCQEMWRFGAPNEERERCPAIATRYCPNHDRFLCLECAAEMHADGGCSTEAVEFRLAKPEEVECG